MTGLQGLYYVATGLWPVFSRRSFEAVTGPKADFWLVQTFGLLITVVGGVLLASRARAETTTPEVRALAAGSAAALGAADTFFVARGRIPPVYLVDALVEGVFLAALGARSLKRGRISRSYKRKNAS
jgi:hypothetical protein